ncbi:GDP-mannose 4,6-dehydratase [Jatrophihabitans sp.]|uniref:GDP-mannose 4,6-dehydratase n=1 Tax=Jatrophihabitans sp. TaxID=1932789 RepID=UPI0030C71B30|nr:GDP-mannose 4,6 dehydratase [Jatrophihabitans sp.]
MPRALITGITGQDGWYLSELLQADGYDVFGLALADDVNPVPPGSSRIVGDVRDSGSLRTALDECEPDEVFNLASISSVGESWSRPELAADINGLGAIRLLAAIRDIGASSGREIRFVQASSAEIFGNAAAPQTEQTPIHAVSPYGAAKAFAHHAVSAYRAAGVWAGAAILFNHESPRRPEQFVTRKITRTVARIAEGSGETLTLGNLAARRDWGYARDYMRAMSLIPRQEQPDDFVIATGIAHSVGDFVAAAFAHVGISDWQPHVATDPAFERAADAAEQRGDATKARSVLGWAPSIDFAELVGLMVDADRAEIATSA